MWYKGTFQKKVTVKVKANSEGEARDILANLKDGEIENGIPLKYKGGRLWRLEGMREWDNIMVWRA